MALQTGQLFGNYRIVRLLGEGGFGEVYLAENPHIERRAAVKVLHAMLAQDSELVRRFLNEARAASAIRHPNIIDVFDAGVTPEGAPYILMEFLEGVSLQNRLAIAVDTGLVRFQKGVQIKDVYLVRGAPESVNSNMSGDRFGEYLVTRGFLRSGDLERALTEMPRFGGKFGEALVGLGFMRPLDVFRLLSQHVRERVMELFTWTQGAFNYYRGMRNPLEAFPLGLSSFEILGAGVVALSYYVLASHFGGLMGFHPRAMPNPRINPEAFRLGPTPREVLGLLDGSLTLHAWAERFGTPDELLTFYRTLYLLVESSMAQFE